MKPFDTTHEAQQWIIRHAQADVEVYIFSKNYIMGGKPWNGTEPKPHGRWDIDDDISGPWTFW